MIRLVHIVAISAFFFHIAASQLLANNHYNVERLNCVVRSPEEPKTVCRTYGFKLGYETDKKIKSYIEEYNRINDGTNPTKALIMLARIYDDGRENPGQNYVNGTAARIALKHARKASITMDCDKVTGSDHELCLSVLQSSLPDDCFSRTPDEPPYLPLPKEVGPYDENDVIYDIKTQVGQRRTFNALVPSEWADDESRSIYVNHYNEINNGTNPTLAAVAFFRILDIAEPEPLSTVSNTIQTVAGYITDYSIPIDCDKVYGPDREVCLTILKTPVFRECYPDLLLPYK